MNIVKKAIIGSLSAAAVVVAFTENKLEPLGVQEADAVVQMDNRYAQTRLADTTMTDNWSQPVEQPKVLDWFSAKPR